MDVLLHFQAHDIIALIADIEKAYLQTAYVFYGLAIFIKKILTL